MRFISPYQRYTIQAVQGSKPVVVDGTIIVEKEGVRVEFMHGGILDWETELGMKRFRFDGLPEGVPAATRLSVFDTEMEALARDWSEETRQEVEQGLLDAPAYGTDYVLVEKPRVEAPWPHYNQVKSVPKLIAKVREDGYDPEEVRQFELQNQNRQEVLDALEALAEEEDEEVEIIA
jgi:hypothetical protein